MQRAHRVTWSAANGPIPIGYEVDHLCYTPRCVNPEHLEAVTPEVNRERIRFHPESRVTHCPKGHDAAYVEALLARRTKEVRGRIAAEIEEYAAPIRKQYEAWVYTYGSAVEPGSRDPELGGALGALFHAARIARGES